MHPHAPVAGRVAGLVHEDLQMKSKKIAFLALTGAVLAATAAHAAEGDSLIPGEFSGSVGLVSDYTFRGISQTDEAAALQGGLTWSHDSGVHLGFWGSNVDFNEAPPVDGASAELDVVAGWGNSIGPFSYDIGAIWYTYPGADENLNYNFVEGTLALGYTVLDGLDVGLLYAVSPEFFADTGIAHFVEGSVSYGFELGLPVSLGATYGRQWIHENARWGTPDYNTWSATAAVTVDAVELGVSYRDTNLSKTECFGGMDTCDARAVAFVTYGF